MKNGFQVVDTDLHVIEPPTLWQDRLPEPYRSMTKIELGAGGHLEVSGYRFELGDVRFNTTSDTVIRQSQQRWEKDPHLAEAHLNANPDLYLVGMDAEGIDVAVLVPTLAFLITTCDGLAPDHADAICRVYNDWVAEFAAAHPDRFKFWAWLPRQAPELAAAEAERAVRELGAAGVAITSGAVEGKLLGDPCFDVLWDAVSRLDVPLGVHLYGTAPGMRDDVQARYHGQPANLARATMNGLYHGVSALPELIGAGVLERYPNLRPMIMEIASAWLLWLVDKMDGMWEMYGSFTDVTLSMRPSDYIRRQCFITVEAEESSLPYLIEQNLTDALVFSTDYPHHDSPWPKGVSTLLSHPISDDAKRKILWDNAQRLFASREAAPVN